MRSPIADFRSGFLPLFVIACFVLFQGPCTLLRAEDPSATKNEEAPAADIAPETMGYEAIIQKHNQAAVIDVRQYVEEHPDAADIDQAFLFLLQNAVALKSDEDALAVADKYLARGKTNPQLKLIALQVRALTLVNQEKPDEAIKALGEILGDGRARNAGAIVDFGFTLANRLQLAGNLKATKQVFERIGEAFPLNQQLESVIETKIDRLELVGSPAPELKGKDWGGKEIDLKEYHGKVLLIDFWATNCGPCLQEMPNLMQSYAKYNPEGFEILGISLDESQEQAESLTKRAQIPWRQVMNDTGSGELSTPYHVPTIPALFLVDQQGKVAYVDLRGDDLRQAIQKLLGSKPSAKQETSPEGGK